MINAVIALRNPDTVGIIQMPVIPHTGDIRIKQPMGKTSVPAKERSRESIGFSSAVK